MPIGAVAIMLALVASMGGFIFGVRPVELCYARLV